MATRKHRRSSTKKSGGDGKTLKKMLSIMRKKNPKITMKNARRRLNQMLSSMKHPGSKF